jgi:hypothetical protein
MQALKGAVSVNCSFKISCGPRLGCRLAAADRDAGIDRDHLCEDVQDRLERVSKILSSRKIEPTFGTVLS